MRMNLVPIMNNAEQNGFADDWERDQEELIARGMSDGLPVVPPTPERVERMLRFNSFDPDEVVAVLEPAFGKATWRSIAHNAVMAGCRPEYLAVVGAAVAAVAADEFNLSGIQTTTGAATTLVIVNGPVVGEIGMNAGSNALGPGNRANATIGRALRLVLQNVGGARPGEMDMSTLGQPGKYTFCLAENEAASPWAPLHVERGFALIDSVVTVVGTVGVNEIVDSISTKPEDLAQTYAQSMLIAGNVSPGGLLGGGEALIVMPPEHAMLFDRAGYTKQQVKAAIYERAVLPLDRLSPAVREHIITTRSAVGAEDSFAPIRVAQQASDVIILVAGGVGIKAAYIPTWGGTTRAVSRLVKHDILTRMQVMPNDGDLVPTWLPSEDLREQVLVRNPARLQGFD